MLKSRIAVLLALLALAFGALGVRAQDQTIAEVAASDSNFSTLVSLVEAAGLTDALNAEGPLTVFAPTNDAFAALTPAVVAYLTDPTHADALTRVLNYHIVPGAVESTAVTAGEAATVEGGSLDIAIDEMGISINGARVTDTDTAASNGVVHAIDAVLIPTFELPEVDALAVSGNVIAAGSSTVFPVTERMADLFNQDGFSGTITVDSVGTGAGFERFCVNAETDISNASRAIRQEEVDSCAANGRAPLEFYIGIDALAVAVSAENTFADNLTLEQLAGVFSGDLATWADVHPDWPAEPIQLFSPGTDSGTFDYFVEAVFDENEEPILNAPGIQLSEDDNVLVQGVLGSPYAIGYFGYAYYQENQETLRALAIEGVVPSEETGASGTYPLSRPLFIYSDATIMQEKPEVAAFVNYYISNVEAQLGPNEGQIGYIPVPENIKNLNGLLWLAAAGGM
jgi:phosphate binding protein